MPDTNHADRVRADAPVTTAAPAPQSMARSTAAWRWSAALVLGVAAMALRVALEPWLDGGVPFVFAFPGVVIAALVTGSRPALLTMLVCVAAPFVPGMPPLLAEGRVPQQLGLFVVASGVVIATCAWLLRRLARNGPATDEVSLADPGRHAQLWLRMLIFAALLLPTVFFVSAAWQARRVAVANAQERVTRAAIIAREHALKIVHMNDLIFDTMEARFDGRDAGDIAAHTPQLQAALTQMVRGLPDVQSLIVWDRDGRLVLDSTPLASTSTLKGADREYFRLHRDHADIGPYMSTPIESRTYKGVWRIVVSERRSTADGAFDGVYAIVLQPNVFSDFYRDLLRNEHSGTVALFRADGSVVVREPPPPTAGPVAPITDTMMGHVHAGDTEGLINVRSLVDGRSRLVAFRKLPGYPLYVSASVADDAILSGWNREVALLAAFTFPTALALAWVSWAALGHTRRERLALDRWRAETIKRAQVEDALRQTQRLEALGHLTGGVAHDVNNLLMVVSNNAYLLRRLLSVGGSPGASSGGASASAAASKAEKPIDAILRAVTTGARLTRQLLAFARRQALRPEVLNLAERLPLLLDLMRHSVSAMVSLDGAVAEGTEFIEVDPAELELALINLAVNARDAMPEGGTLRVEIRNATASEHQGLGHWVSITVRDSGEGIPSEVLEHVFEPFFTTKEQGKGTGLGLSQVYGFCQQAGGIARIESTPGEGTAVQLLLPATSGAPEAAEEPPPVPAADGRLLLVEDNAEVAEATEPMLSSWGYAVRSARSGDAARELMQQAGGDFDLLLTDIVMPGATDGLTLARHVRGLYPHIGIVLMTGHARETDKAMSEGFVVLQKPWTPQALASALDEAHPRKRTAV